MVSWRKVVAAISVLLIIWLILGLFLPPFLMSQIIRHLPYQVVPDWGSGVIVGSDDDSTLTNITIESVPFNTSVLFDPSMIMAIVDPADPPRYWRQTAYDTYTGSSWQKSRTNTEQPLSTVPRGGEIIYTITQNLSIGLGGSHTLFCLWPDPMIIDNSITSPHLPDPSHYDLEVDDYNTAILQMRFSSNGSTTLQYQVTYNPLNWTTIRPQAGSASLTPSSLAHYQTQGLDRLSATTRADIQNRLNTILPSPDNAFEEAFAILDYFKATFAFDAQYPRPGSSDEPVEYFLTHGRGVGLDFATTYIMFLRERGIAARIVLGAVLGANFGTHRVLYLMHMHFWVEVYVPTSSSTGYWLQFDPTPLPSYITDGSPPTIPHPHPPPTLTPPPPDEDPYVISTYYDLTIDVPIPVVDRGQVFQVRATLTKDGQPEPNETIWFYDDTEHWLLGTDVTSATGVASISFAYNNSAIVGIHILRVEFHSRSEYSGIGLHGPANLTLTVTPLEVNRTMFITYNGTLRDAINGRGISSNETLFTGVQLFLNFVNVTSALPTANGNYWGTYRVPTNQAPLGPTLVFSAFTLPSIIDWIVSFPPMLMNITALSQLTLSVIPNAVRVNSNATLSGQLQYDNGTALPGQTIQIYWNDTLIGSTITDTSGNFLYNHTPTDIGQVTVEARFQGGKLVYGSSVIANARVHDEGTIVVLIDDDDGDDITQRGATVHCTGWVENSTGSRQGGVTVLIFFNSSQVVQTTTFTNGSFIIDFQIGSSQPVGYFIVTGNVSSATLVVQSTTDSLILNTSTQIQSLQFSTSCVMVGESVLLSGQLVDDQGVGVASSDVILNLNYLSITIPVSSVTTQADGTFQYLLTIPGTISQTVQTVIFEANFSGSRYFGSSIATQPLDIFTNATLDLEIPTGVQLGGSNILINGTLQDNFSRPLSHREIRLFVDATERSLAITNAQGRVSFNLTIGLNLLPRQVNITIQLQHQTVRTISSVIGILTVEAAPMQQPSPIPLELILIVVVIIIAIVVAVVLYRYWKRRPRRTRVPSIDAAAMLTTLRQLLADQKYRESIIYAFRMFETLVQAKLGVFRDPSITLREFANLTVAQGRLDTRSMEVFVRSVEEARFSDRPVSYNTALMALNAFASIYNSLTGGNLRFVTQEQQES